MKKFIIHQTKQNNFLVLEVNVSPDINPDGTIARYVIKNTYRDLPINAMSHLPYSVEPNLAFDSLMDADNYIRSIFPNIQNRAIKSCLNEINYLNKKLEKIKNKKVSIRTIHIAK